MHQLAAIHADVAMHAVTVVATRAVTTAAVHDWAIVCETCSHAFVLADADADTACSPAVIAVAIQAAVQRVVAMQVMLVPDADATSSV